MVSSISRGHVSLKTPEAYGGVQMRMAGNSRRSMEAISGL
jgi:hypothetical protein